jgi:hypothetical protein
LNNSNSIDDKKENNSFYDPLFLKKSDTIHINQQNDAVSTEKVLVEKTTNFDASLDKKTDESTLKISGKLEKVTTNLKENLVDVTEKTIQQIGTISENITEKTKEQLQKHGDESVQNVNKTLIFTVTLCIIFAIATLGAVIMYADGQQQIKASEAMMKGISEKHQKTISENTRLNRMIDQLKTRLNECVKSQYDDTSLASPRNKSVMSNIDGDFLGNLPVDINFRSSWLGNGKVLVLTNHSDKHLTVSLKVKNKIKNGEFSINLAPKTKKDWGHLEGWAFNKDDELSINVIGYKQVSKLVP